MNATAPEPETTRKFFTPESANLTLPLVKMIVADIVSLFLEIRERRERLADITGSDAAQNLISDVYREEVEEMENSIDSDIARLQGYIAELDQLGIDLNDPETGLIDFPGWLDDREICLCWKPGDDAVSYWHEVNADDESRHPIGV